MKREDIILMFLKTCHMIHSKGLVSGSGGNVSIRLDDEIIITPSGKSLESLKEDDLVYMDMDGNYRSANNSVPSKEWRMHIGCYKRDSVKAVIHVHSTYAVAVSCLENLNNECAIPIYTSGYGMRVGRLPVVKYNLPGSEELAKDVSSIIMLRNSVMMENHGIIAVEKNLEDALNLIEEIESEAKMHFILDGKGKALPENIQQQLYS